MNTTFTTNSGMTYSISGTRYFKANPTDGKKIRISKVEFELAYDLFVKEENERQNATNEFTNIDPITYEDGVTADLFTVETYYAGMTYYVVKKNGVEVYNGACVDEIIERFGFDPNVYSEIEIPRIEALIEEAEESAKTEEAEEIVDLYCRHPEGTDLQVPAVFNQYGCVDCSKCNVQNCVHRDCMRRNPTSEGGLAECPRLKVKAEEPKAEKRTNKRVSKNTAWGKIVGGVDVSLTAKQVDFIKHLPDTCFWENGLDSTIWVDCLCDDIQGQFANKPMTVGAMISTLCEKGLGTRATCRREKRKCTSFELTELGKLVAAEVGLQ